jgi:alanyl-tRNA synthetase
MQYEQITKDIREDLPKPSIDTGMGLERVAALLQNTNDDYATDIFTPLINKSIELTNSDEKANSSSHRVIADHLRSASFLITDGVLPSNEGRGYVLRRIMRRGMRHAHSLGNKEPIFHKIFPTLLHEMKDSYPELNRAKDLILNILLNEEKKFKQTIDNGIKILEDEIKNTQNNLFSGEVAFKLYDTFGFPLDLTQDYLKNKKILVDVDSFNKKMEEQKKRARQSWKGTGDIEENKIWLEVTDKIKSTEFLGFEQSGSESIILSLISDNKSVDKLIKGEEGVIILNQTPFYGESGGQVGDNGYLQNENFKFNVNNTTKIFGNYFLHWGQVIKGSCNVGEVLEAYIDYNRRHLIKCNHSSTHLLHSALREVLGNHIFQKGSLVNDEKLRFDFSHNDMISEENLKKIELLVNKIIKQRSPVQIELQDHNEAVNSGAIALFGEKYGDEVRVVEMGKDRDNFFSRELCGGTHVNNTGDIEKFKIINESSIASGIRRIEALTNISVNIFNRDQESKQKDFKMQIKKEINKYIDLIKIINPQKIYNIDLQENLEEQLKKIKKIYNDNKQNIDIAKNKENIKIEKIGNYNLIYLLSNNYPSKALKMFIDEQKKLHPKESIIVLVSTDQNKVSIIVGLTDDLTNIYDATNIVKVASTIVGGKGGGGRKDLAQAGGNIPDKADKIYNEIKKEVLKLT